MSLEIQLSNGYWLTSDKHGYQINVFAGYDKNEVKIWRPQKFTGTIGSALESYRELAIRSSDATTIQELRDKLEEIKQEIRGIREALEVT